MKFFVNLDPYAHSVMFCLGAPFKSVVGNLRAIGLSEQEIEGIKKGWDDRSRTTARTWQFSTGQQIIHMAAPPMSASEISLLVHEVFHACCFVLDRAGMKLCKETEEAYAYLISRTTEQALKIVGKTTP